MFDSNDKLDIFENFETDRTLEKYLKMRRLEDEDLNMEGGSFGTPMMRRSRGTVRFQSGISNLAMSDEHRGQLQRGVGIKIKPFSWAQRLALWFLNLVSSEKMVVRTLHDALRPEPEPTMTVREFFHSVKVSTEDLEFVDQRVRGYEAAMERARNSGQVALVEALQNGIEAARSETHLHAIELTTVLREETLVEFVKKSPKGLRLDWVKNFTRHIPDEVLEVKSKCDELCIFDNYAVLHFDPESKSWAETQADIERRKDPILFGVLNGKRQLYFVGEWIDEYCNLTMDGIADVLGLDESGHTTLDVGAFEGSDLNDTES